MTSEEIFSELGHLLKGTPHYDVAAIIENLVNSYVIDDDSEVLILDFIIYINSVIKYQIQS